MWIYFISLPEGWSHKPPNHPTLSRGRQSMWTGKSRLCHCWKSQGPGQMRGCSGPAGSPVPCRSLAKAHATLSPTPWATRGPALGRARLQGAACSPCSQDPSPQATTWSAESAGMTWAGACPQQSQQKRGRCRGADRADQAPRAVLTIHFLFSPQAPMLPTSGI